MAIVRKVRVLFWTAMGVVFLVRRGLVSPVRQPAEEVRS
jgi:hypothetical protein